MQAVILAAGLGSRLRPLTNNIPKAMVKFKSKEIILHQIETLIENGIKEILVVTGYRSIELKNFVTSKFNNVKLYHNKNYNNTNSAYSFSCIKDHFFSDSYIHLNCDILFDSSLLKELIQYPEKNVIACRNDLTLKDSMENVSIDSSNKILKMSQKKFSNGSLKAFGMAKISNEAMRKNLEIFNSLDHEVGRNENYYGLIRRSLKINPFYALLANCKTLAEFNTEEDLINSEFIFT